MSLIKTLEADAAKVLHFLIGAEQKIATVEPKVVAALGVLAGGVETALTDAAAVAANPTSIVLNLGTDITDFKAVWPEVKAFLETLGIKV